MDEPRTAAAISPKKLHQLFDVKDALVEGVMTNPATTVSSEPARAGTGGGALPAGEASLKRAAEPGGAYVQGMTSGSAPALGTHRTFANDAWNAPSV
ncbi:hypothetical protein SAMN05216188_10528 [Lentzea xinjiangensis]|uniref:Uncharacterized protein n=1 Tax=Lentzea xinjiangensis TaxID=402600 RepID=A0A1H9IPR6_9PSEU|nr:hypothetical protein SAMN05216188_10528 [Lentzea xinjiangensis]